jgi:hypothetical protein
MGHASAQCTAQKTTKPKFPTHIAIKISEKRRLTQQTSAKTHLKQSHSSILFFANPSALFTQNFITSPNPFLF